MSEDPTDSPSSPRTTRRAPVENADGVDPVEFLRKLMQISPEDAASVRDDAARAAGTAPREKPKRTDTAE